MKTHQYLASTLLRQTNNNSMTLLCPCVIPTTLPNAYRLAAFVSKTIDNVGEKITVKDAMEHLGLKRFLFSLTTPQLWFLTRSLSKHHFLPGMEVRLLPHQIIGVSWMVRQERDSGLRGGILADEMGLWVPLF